MAAPSSCSCLPVYLPFVPSCADSSVLPQDRRRQPLHIPHSCSFPYFGGFWHWVSPALFCWSSVLSDTYAFSISPLFFFPLSSPFPPPVFSIRLAIDITITPRFPRRPPLPIDVFFSTAGISQGCRCGLRFWHRWRLFSPLERHLLAAGSRTLPRLCSCWTDRRFVSAAPS